MEVFPLVYFKGFERDSRETFLVLWLPNTVNNVIQVLHHNECLEFVLDRACQQQHGETFLENCLFFYNISTEHLKNKYNAACSRFYL